MIAIHHTPGTYSERWIAYCEANGVPFRRVNCLDSDILAQCRDVRGLLWQWRHDEPREKLCARQIIAGLEEFGTLVFPNLRTSAHYDDKLAQKYLLEAIDAPLVPTWIFYSEEEALAWVNQASWPKVFKLRCGAGSNAVQLVRSCADAESLVRRAFGAGFVAVGGYFTDARSRVRKTKGWAQIWAKIRRAPHTIARRIALRRETPRERGYIYFQEFLPNNAFDTRITVIGERAFGFTRGNRPDDFRASGSGNIVYDRSRIDERCVRVAFEVAARLRTQSLAFDFLFDPAGRPMIGEISYCYIAAAVHACAGHWRRNGEWCGGNVWPEDAIIEDLLRNTVVGRLAAAAPTA